MELNRELHLGPEPCPASILKVRQTLAEMEPGQTLHVVSSNPSTPKALHDYARQVGLDLIVPPKPETDSQDHFLVRKPA